MGCEYLYKDEDGNPSAVYARALAQHGPEVAEQIYVRYMLNTINTKFSLPLRKSLDEIEADGRKLKITQAEDAYVNPTTSKMFVRVTDYLESIIQRYKAKDAGQAKIQDALKGTDSLAIAKTKLADKLILSEFGPGWKHLTDAEKAAYIAKRIKDDPTLPDRAKAEIEAMWKASPLGGTTFHSLVDQVLTRMEVLYNDKSNTDADGNKKQISISQIWSITNDVRNANLKDWQIERKGYTVDKFDVKEIATFVTDLVKEIQKVETKIGRHLIMKPEFKVSTTGLVPPGSALDGIAGTIDLLLVDEKNEFAMTVDFKTKNASKIGEFDKVTGTFIGGPFQEIDNTSAQRARAQQALYAAILLEETGIRVSDTMTMEIPITYSTLETKPMGSNVYIPTGVGVATTAGPIPLGSLLSEINTHFKEGNLKEYYDKMRLTGISGVVESWSNGQATFTKDHKDKYLKNKILQKFENPVSKKMVIDTMEGQIDVTGKSDDEIRAELSAIYDRTKEDQSNIARDIIGFFTYSGTKGYFLPRGLRGKENALTTLLAGFDKSTHTIHRAQGYLKELEGIGPDVLIVENNVTKALSFISAVTISNSKVDFDDDGTGRRSSLIGKYATNKQVKTAALDPRLISTPQTHDFLAMKLALAALYIRRATGKSIAIDRMRVTSMNMGPSVQSTQTTFDVELKKLQLFADVAEDDFPAEYKELLKFLQKTKYAPTMETELYGFMKTLRDNMDPLNDSWIAKDTRGELIKVYDEMKDGKFVSSELRRLIGDYFAKLYKEIGGRGQDIRKDPRYIAVARVLLEIEGFDKELGEVASRRVNVKYIRGAVSSGDKILTGLHTRYNNASAKIRMDMNEFSKEHKRLLSALQKDRNSDLIGDSEKTFGRLYKKSDNPEDRMMLYTSADPEYSKLSTAERAYLDFINENMPKALARSAAMRYKEGILSGRLWKPGSVPVVFKGEELVTKETMTNWSALKKAIESKWKGSGKVMVSNEITQEIDWDFATRFDNQATDEGIGNSRTRRDRLGLEDMSNPGTMPSNIETNLAFIMNSAMLESAEKEHKEILLQTFNAAEAILYADGDEKAIGMTAEMMQGWKNMVMFSRYAEEPSQVMARGMDVLNQLSSTALFTYSLKQGLVEFSTGTLQNMASLMSNMIQNQVAEWTNQPQNVGRFTMPDWIWASRAWNKYDQKLEQISYDLGIVTADPDDLKTPEFRGQSKFNVFKSESGFWLNRLFFNTAISHTFFAIMKNQGIIDAYKNVDGVWTYDEELDSRFYAYDAENGIGEKPPETDDEKKRYSLWVAVRSQMDKEGTLHKVTNRMILPMTANERSEIKHYATRLYGSFNKDAIIHGEIYSVIRGMFRYKKWFFSQRVANYWTPTIRDEAMYGHWEQEQDEDGNFHTVWKGDDFEGIIQTLTFITKELARTRDASFLNGSGLNKYQRENVSKLLADLLISLMMMFMVLPFMSGMETEVDPVTGKETTTTKDWAKSSAAQSLYKAGVNATADLFLVNSIPGMTRSMFPGLSVLSGLGTGAWKLGKSYITEGEDAWETTKQYVGKFGAGTSLVPVIEFAENHIIP
jgi:hypothetical protein